MRTARPAAAGVSKPGGQPADSGSPARVPGKRRSAKSRAGASGVPQLVPEQALRDSELRYRRLFEAAQDGIMILHARTGAIEDVNPYMIEMLGYSREEFLGKKLWEVGAFTDIEASKQAFRQLQHADYIRYHDLPLKTKRGQLIQAEFVSNLYRVDRRELIQCNIRENTENARAHRALAESENRLRTLFAAMTAVVIVYDADGRYLEIAPTNTSNLYRPPADLLGKTVSQVFPPDHARLILDQIRKTLQTGQVTSLEYGLRIGDRNVPFSASVSPLSPNSVIWVAHDITQRKHAEDAWRRSEALLVRTSQVAKVGGWELDPGTMELIWTPETYRIHEVESTFKPDLETAIDFYAPEARPIMSAAVRRAIEEGAPYDLELPFITAKDTHLWVRAIGRPEVHGGKCVRLSGTFQDVTDRVQAAQALKDSETRFRAMVESGLDNISVVTADGVLLWESPAVARNFGYSPDEVVGRNILALVHPDELDWFRGMLAALIRAPQTLQRGSFRLRRRDGAWRWIEAVATNLLNEPAVSGIVFNYHDVTERKQAEALEQAVYRIATAAQTSSSLDDLYPQIHEIIASVMPAENLYFALYDEKQDSLRYPYVRDTVERDYSDELQRGRGLTAYVLRTGKSLLCTRAAQDELERKGEVIRVGVPSAIWLGVPLTVAGRTIGAIVVQHYSDAAAYGEREQHILEFVSSQVAVAITRKEAEHALRQAEYKYRGIFENAQEAITQSTPDGRFLTANPAAARMLGFTSPKALLAGVPDLNQGFYVEPGRRDELVRLLEGAGTISGFESQVYRSDGTTMWISETSRVVRDQQGSVLYYEGMTQDITERKRAEATIRRQLDRLRAMSEIDRAVASSFDLRLSLSILLSHALRQLEVDAGSVLVLDLAAQTLEFVAGSGFHGPTLQHTRLSLGQGYAGMAALNRQIVSVTDLRTRHTDLLRSPTFKSEEFDSYVGVPLIAKGQLQGVLEIFHRSPLHPDQEWLDFLNTLAGQAAIAIDNAAMLTDLQRSRFDLSAAYDATLEGWSRALDLRDEETEGHTQRVTEMTLRLARLLGVPDEDLVHVRRGALLHDIGKMGVPDSILLKPGPLTDAEWVLMRQHPVLAHDLLSPIHYLRLSVDIPYCHHEKWDGSGYPRGLKGDQIPRAARIFAVVDVWDALTSDRPYRKAWTREKAVEYMRSASGSHFDPQVVDMFFKEILKDGSRGADTGE